MAEDGPQLVRPIPRRPFNFNFTSASPTDEDSPSSSKQDIASPHHLSAALDKLQSSPGSRSSSLSRPQSFLNLTSSTLYGIYSPMTPTRDRVFGDRDENDTPLDAGAQTPVRRPSVNDATFELMRERAHLKRRKSSFRAGDSFTKHDISITSLVVRTSLLFILGLGYGALVTRFQEEKLLSTPVADTIIQPGYNTKYLAFWGVSGVFLGSLLPWFDRIWERTFGVGISGDDEAIFDSDSPTQAPNTDMTLVMRAIGAFVGIFFAIRKLSWSSTLQISLALALVNPLLWWLIDRSKPGFVLSAFVGFTGSILLMGVNPEIMPTPSRQLLRNTTTGMYQDHQVMLGGFASQETVETGVWMLSVLFCSCVCFGNIGRRLTWGGNVVAKGRWAGVR